MLLTVTNFRFVWRSFEKFTKFYTFGTAKQTFQIEVICTVGAFWSATECILWKYSKVQIFGNNSDKAFTRLHFCNKCYHLVRYLCLPICCLIMQMLNYAQNCNFSVLLYGHESHILTLKEEHRLKKFNDRVLMRTVSCNKLGSVIVAQNGC